jgi:hypothetical protein
METRGLEQQCEPILGQSSIPRVFRFMFFPSVLRIGSSPATNSGGGDWKTAGPSQAAFFRLQAYIGRGIVARNGGNPRWQFVLAGIAIVSAVVYLLAWLIFGLLKL